MLALLFIQSGTQDLGNGVTYLQGRYSTSVRPIKLLQRRGQRLVLQVILDPIRLPVNINSYTALNTPGPNVWNSGSGQRDEKELCWKTARMGAMTQDTV